MNLLKGYKHWSDIKDTDKVLPYRATGKSWHPCDGKQNFIVRWCPVRHSRGHEKKVHRNFQQGSFHLLVIKYKIWIYLLSKYMYW